MKIKVGIKDWVGQSGDRQDRNVKMFEGAGAEVIEIDMSSEEPPKVQPHFTWTPIPGVENKEGVAQVSQLGGFGNWYTLPSLPNTSPLFEQTFKNSDIVICLDPILWESIGRRHDDMRVIPLGVPHNFEDIGEREDGKFNVLNPMGCRDHKRPEDYIEGVKLVGETHPQIHFYLIQKHPSVYQLPAEYLEIDNLTILPQMPYEEVKDYFALADIIAPFSASEVFPNTVMEAYTLDKPIVTRMMGKIQTIHTDYLEEVIKDFGMEVGEFDKKHSDKYGTGDHYQQVDNPIAFADKVIDIYENPDEFSWDGSKWIDEFWSLEDRGERIIDTFKEYING